MNTSHNIPVLIDTIIRLKRLSQAEIADQSQIHRSNLSRFLSGDVDIRLSSLISILDSLEIRMDNLLQDEIDNLLGKAREGSSEVGEAFEHLLKNADPLVAKTVLDSLTNRIKNKDKKTETAVQLINSYKSSLKRSRRLT